MDKRLLEILVCPLCKGPLQLRHRHVVAAARHHEDGAGVIGRRRLPTPLPQAQGRGPLLGADEQQRRRGLGLDADGPVEEVVGRVVAGAQLGDVGDLGAVGLARPHGLEPGAHVGLGVGPGRGEVAGGVSDEVEARGDRLLPHAGPLELVGRDDGGIEGPAVGHQRQKQVAPAEERHRGGDAEGGAVRARPRAHRAVLLHHPVVEGRHEQRHPGAVGLAGEADPLRVGDALVDEEADGVLDVAALVAHVVEADVAAVARLGTRGAGLGRAARVAPAPGGELHHRVALGRPGGGGGPGVLGVVGARGRRAPAVALHDQRVAAVVAGLPRRREGDVHGQRRAVEALEAQIATAEQVAVADPDTVLAGRARDRLAARRVSRQHRVDHRGRGAGRRGRRAGRDRPQRHERDRRSEELPHPRSPSVDTCGTRVSHRSARGEGAAHPPGRIVDDRGDHDPADVIASSTGTVTSGVRPQM